MTAEFDTSVEISTELRPLWRGRVAREKTTLDEPHCGRGDGTRLGRGDGDTDSDSDSDSEGIPVARKASLETA